MKGFPKNGYIRRPPFPVAPNSPQSGSQVLDVLKPLDAYWTVKDWWRLLVEPAEAEAAAVEILLRVAPTPIAFRLFYTAARYYHILSYGPPQP